MKGETSQISDEATQAGRLSLVEAHVLPMLRGESPEANATWDEICRLALGAMAAADVSYLKRAVLWRCLSWIMRIGARRGDSLLTIERKLRRFFRLVLRERRTRRPSQLKRARHYYNLIAPRIVGNRVLDLGAGDGLLAKLIHDEANRDVVLIDVMDFNASSLPIIIYNPDEPLPVDDGAFDTTVICAVLHHSDDPVVVLAEAARVTARRIVAIEGDISSPRKHLVNCFFDWFLNRVALGQDMEVPLNFRTEDEWMPSSNALACNWSRAGHSAWTNLWPPSSTRSMCSTSLHGQIDRRCAAGSDRGLEERIRLRSTAARSTLDHR